MKKHNPGQKTWKKTGRKAKKLKTKRRKLHR